MLVNAPAVPASNPVLRDETVGSEAITGRAGFFRGRGPGATARAVFTSAAPSPPPDPFTLATLPVGKRLLGATTAEAFDSALVELATAWTSAGYGDAKVRDDGPLDPDPLGVPPRDGLPEEDCLGMDDCGECEAHREPEPTRWAWYRYAFDEGQVLCFLPRAYHATIHADAWNTIHLPAEVPSHIELTPTGRTYGEAYLATAALDLPAVAVWIMAELTTLGRSAYSPIWPHVRYGAVVNTTLNEIKLCLYGLEADEPAVSRRAFREIEAVARAHNWSNRIVGDDRRFQLFNHVVPKDAVIEYRRQGRAPGTVTVVTDDHPFWQ
ncbi:hypothetical protein [Amycolatopsis sp. NPDC098790]|uniref:hypothetical protein n=1 Tax=Amycolatopsis sp. NPDC098790 TaxID=3363939 RepID=UPI00380EEE57